MIKKQKLKRQKKQRLFQCERRTSKGKQYKIQGKTKNNSKSGKTLRGSKTLMQNKGQKLTPVRSGHAGSESEVQNLEILHPDLEIKTSKFRKILSK